MANKVQNIIGLFAGVGGIEEGFKRAGFTPILANELDNSAAITYRESHPEVALVEGSIENLSYDDLKSALAQKYHSSPKPEIKGQILTGGFPCQPFSVAGYKKGFEDPRGNVFWSIIRLINELKPEVVFLENVKNLKTHDEHRTFRRIKNSLEMMDVDNDPERLTTRYFVREMVLNSFDYGFPQTRERIFIVAFRNKKAFDAFKFPSELMSPEKWDRARERNRDLARAKLAKVVKFSEEVDEKYYYDAKRPFFDELNAGVKESGVIYQWRRHYVRENKSGVSPTLTANMGMGGHNVPIIRTQDGRIRKLTPSECFALMGFRKIKFPAGMSESALYKQAGNAVVVGVVELIAKNIKVALEK